MLGYGQNIVSARRFTPLAVGQWTANTADVVGTGRFGCPVGSPNIRILGIHVLVDTVPVDADGVMTLSVKAYDASEAAEDAIVTALDGETVFVAANVWYEATLVAETSEEERTLNPGDSLYVELTNNSAAIDTNANVYALVEWIFVPRDQEDEDETAYVGYASQMAADF
jgi:hypothetical protein